MQHQSSSHHSSAGGQKRKSGRKAKFVSYTALRNEVEAGIRHFWSKRVTVDRAVLRAAVCKSKEGGK